MHDLSFSAFIQENKTPEKFSKIAKLSDINVLMIYAEYLKWLADFTHRLENAPPQLRVRDYLAQLKVITDYYVYLLQQQSNKRLTHGIDLPNVPDALLKDDSEKLHSNIPTKNVFYPAAIASAKKRRFIHAVSNGLNFGMMLVLFTWIILGMTLGSPSGDPTLFFAFFTGPLFTFSSYSLIVGGIDTLSWYKRGIFPSEKLPKPTAKSAIAALVIGLTCSLLAFTQPFGIPVAAIDFFLWLPGIMSTMFLGILGAEFFADLNAKEQKSDFVIKLLPDAELHQDGDVQSKCREYVKADIAEPFIRQVDSVDTAVKKTLCTYHASKLRYPEPSEYDDEILPANELAEVFREHRCKA